MAAVVCSCGRPIVQAARGRPRKRCEVCSPPENRRQRQEQRSGPVVVRRIGPVPVPPSLGMPPTAQPELEIPAPVPHVPGEVELALRDVLVKADRLGRYQAVLAVRLARQLDSSTTVTSAQALAQQIDALMAKALDGYDPDPPAPDFVDEMRDRRVRSRGAG